MVGAIGGEGQVQVDPKTDRDNHRDVREIEAVDIGRSNCAIKTEQIAKSKGDEKIRLSYVLGIIPYRGMLELYRLMNNI